MIGKSAPGLIPIAIAFTSQIEDNPVMPRRDVVLTGILAFGAGVAVGANWKKIGGKAAPLLEQLGLKMSDLADFLAEITEEVKTEEKPAKVPRARSSRKKVSSSQKKESVTTSASHRNGKNGHVAAVRASGKRKSLLTNPAVLAE